MMTYAHSTAVFCAKRIYKVASGVPWNITEKIRVVFIDESAVLMKFKIQRVGYN